MCKCTSQDIQLASHASTFSWYHNVESLSLAEAQVQKAEIAKELKAINQNPEFAFQEMIKLFEHEGVSKEDAQHISEILQHYQQSYKKTMVEKELGIDMQPDTVMR